MSKFFGSKFIGNDKDWESARDKVSAAKSDYGFQVCYHNMNVTREQAEVEFWQRVALYFGFELTPIKTKEAPWNGT